MDLLEKLISTFGVSGNEDAVRSLIMEEIKNYVDEVFVDKLGNLIAHKKGERPKVMLTAHMDEIGLIAKDIEGRGRITFSTIGFIDPSMLLGERVHIETEKGIIHGVITCKEVNDGKILSSIPKIEELFVDTGLNKIDLKKLGIEVGTFMALERDLYYLGSENIICGKAFDDRVGCYALIELAKRLKEISKNEIYYVFTIQEEIGLIGALTSTYIVEPDWAIAVDVTETLDASETSETIGRGPCLTIKDAQTIGNRTLNKYILEAARKNKIHIQKIVSEEGTTDAASISITKGGVPCTVLGICVRNLHTATSVASLNDIEELIKILEELLKSSPEGELWK